MGDLARDESKQRPAMEVGAPNAKAAKPIEDPLGAPGRVLLAAHLVAWALIFAAGAVVSTAHCREAFLEPEALSQAQTLRCGLLVLVCYTPCNVAWLAALAGVLGAMGRIARLTPHHPHPANDDLVHPYLSGAIRGFFVYLAVISGILVISSDPFTSPNPGQYLRIAGLVSLFSFLVSYNPGLFARMLMRLGTMLEETPEKAPVVGVRRPSDGGGPV